MRPTFKVRLHFCTPPAECEALCQTSLSLSTAQSFRPDVAADSVKTLGQSQDETSKQLRITAKRQEAVLGQMTKVEEIVQQLAQRLDHLASSSFEERIAKANDSFESLAKAVHKQQEDLLTVGEKFIQFRAEVSGRLEVMPACTLIPCSMQCPAHPRDIPHRTQPQAQRCTLYGHAIGI